MSLLTVFTIFLVECVIFVNGWTDAPNAIVSAVTSRAMNYRSAVLMAAVCNMAGVFTGCLVSGSVAGTLTSMVDFGAGNIEHALLALLCVMATIVLFAVSAWIFGIPTSESHALIGALIGAALALDPQRGVDRAIVLSVFAGLIVSVLFGVFAGAGVTKLLSPMRKILHKNELRHAEIGTAGLLSFLHGAQDGQKFIAVLIIARMLSAGFYSGGEIVFANHLPTVFITSVTMALGTLVGGKRIIETVGEKMVSVDMYEGLCSDIATIAGLFIATVSGMPVSTTHAKTSSMLGTAMCSGKRASAPVAFSMMLTWFITLPVCAVIGYFLTVACAGFLA